MEIIQYFWMRIIQYLLDGDNSIFVSFFVFFYLMGDGDMGDGLGG